MVSYFKTQWFRLLVAILCLVFACTFFFGPAPDMSTLEGLVESDSIMFSGFGWLLASASWFIMSFVDYNTLCIEKLDKRLKAVEEANDIETE